MKPEIKQLLLLIEEGKLSEAETLKAYALLFGKPEPEKPEE